MKNLKNLNKEQLKAVIEEASFLLAVHNETSSNKEIFYYCLSACLKKISVSCPPFGVAKKASFYKKFLEVSSFIETFIDKNLSSLDKQERTKSYYFFIWLIINYLQKETELQISMTTVLNYFEYIPQLIQKAYPFYIENGFLETIIRRWFKNVNDMQKI